MTLRTVSYKLRSSSPLMLHSGQLADPLNKYSKAIKAISSKRKKTDADFEEMARLEFMGGLYLTKDGPAIPADNITAMIVKAAMKHKEGDMAKTGIFVEDHASIEYTGPRDPDAMWKAETFRDTRGAKIGKARIMRTRPIFQEWSSTVTFTIDDEVVNPSRVDEWLAVAGRAVGLCELRPRYGRFTVERV
jgi:hypothetical protein